jgi:hypothetical protein
LLVLAPSRGFAQANTSNCESPEYAQGRALREERRDQEAYELFRRLFERDHAVCAEARMGLALRALGRWSEAEMLLADALSHASDPWVQANRAPLEGQLVEIRGHVGTYDVVVNPPAPGAELWVAGWRVGAVPLTQPVHLNEGPVVVEVRAPGYVTLQHTVTIEPTHLHRETLTLVPVATAPSTGGAIECPPDTRQVGTTCEPLPPGHVALSIQPLPHNVRVLLDGQPVVASQPLAVRAGAHLVRVEASGYRPLEHPFTIAAGQELPIALTLTAATGVLVISTANADALVSVDGSQPTPSPARFEGLGVGRHQVTVSARGFEPSTTSVEVNDEHVSEVTIPALARTEHALHIEARGGEFDVEIEQDGRVRRCSARVSENHGCTVRHLVEAPVQVRVPGHAAMNFSFTMHPNASVVLEHRGLGAAPVAGVAGLLGIAGAVVAGVFAGTTACADYDHPVETGGFAATVCPAPVGLAVGAGLVGVGLGIAFIAMVASPHDSAREASSRRGSEESLRRTRSHVALNPTGIGITW